MLSAISVASTRVGSHRSEPNHDVHIMNPPGLARLSFGWMNTSPIAESSPVSHGEMPCLCRDDPPPMQAKPDNRTTSIGMPVRVSGCRPRHVDTFFLVPHKAGDILVTQTLSFMTPWI